MKLGWFAVAGLVLVGVAGVLTWSHLDQANKLKSGTFRKVELEVVEARSASTQASGGLLQVRWQAADGSEQEGVALIALADVKSGKFAKGQKVAGWVHPGLWRPSVGEQQPSLEADQQFMAYAAAVCAAIGLGLLGFAAATGRLLSD